MKEERDYIFEEATGPVMASNLVNSFAQMNYRLVDFKCLYSEETKRYDYILFFKKEKEEDGNWQKILLDQIKR